MRQPFKKSLLIITLFTIGTIFLSACGASTPSPTYTPLPPTVTIVPPTLTPVPPTPTPDDGWDIIPGGSHLESDFTAACIPGLSTAPEGVVYAPTYNREPNLFNTHLNVKGDFGLFLLLYIQPKQYAGITLFDQLPWSFLTSNFRRSWWNGFKRLNLFFTQNGLEVTLYDGNQNDPLQSYSFALDYTKTPLVFKFRRIGNEFVISQGEQEIGRFTDDGFFANGVVYYGLEASNEDQLTLYELSAQVPRGQTDNVQIASFFDPVHPETAADLPSLKALAELQGIFMGSEVLLDTYTVEPQYAQMVTYHYNLWPAPRMGFENFHPSQDRYDFCYGDLFTRIAADNGAMVQGNHLIWWGQMGDWMARPNATAAEITAGNGTRFSTEEWRTIFTDYIKTVVERYKGQVRTWSVVNEAIRDPGETAQVAPGMLRDTQWLAGVGPDYIDLAFQTAHEADPDALLFYNEYNADGLGGKSDAVYELVKGMLERGIPIDGVGLQMHIKLENHPTLEDIAANIQRLTDLGLKVQITEMDISIKDAPGSMEQKLTRQAQLYKDILTICLQNPKCDAFITWGFTDKYSWLTGYTITPNEAPLIFDTNYLPKPAFNAIVEALRESP